MTAPPVVEVRQLTKTYGGVVAVDNVSMEFRPGSIHSLVGANGAGKSTLLGMLAGRVVPTSGVVAVAGREYRSVTPRAARDAGVVAIYQELTIVPAMSAVANVFLAEPVTRGGLLDRPAMRRRYAELLRVAGARIAPDAEAKALSVADQQLLEVMRALHAEAKLIIFDEPTAPLALEARGHVLDLMRSLRDHGVAVVFVSHHLEEVLEVSDEITVFRDGRIVSQATASTYSKETLIDSMLGTHHAAEPQPAERRRDPSAEIVLEVREVRLPGVLHDISLQLHRGEILGVAGLVGAGRSSLLRTLAGHTRGGTGRIVVDGQEHALPRSVREALRLGLALLPEDRKSLGVVARMTAADNIVIGTTSTASRLGFVTRRRIRRAVDGIAKDFDVRPEYLERPAADLSGGNQQKLLLARNTLREPVVLLADEPTRGIDVGAKRQTRETLRRLAEQGLSIIVVSAEHEELLELSDRLIVLSKGRITATIDNTHHQAREQDILRAAFDRGSDRVA